MENEIVKDKKFKPLTEDKALQHLNTLRQDSNMSLESFCLELGITRQTFHNYMTGATPVHYNTLQKALMVFGWELVAMPSESRKQVRKVVDGVMKVAPNRKKVAKTSVNDKVQTILRREKEREDLKARKKNFHIF